MDKLGFGISNGCVGEGNNNIKKGKQALEHTGMFFFRSFEWVNKELKNRFGKVLTYEEDVAIVTWILAKQEVGLYINLQQLKLKWKI